MVYALVFKWLQLDVNDSKLFITLQKPSATHKSQLLTHYAAIHLDLSNPKPKPNLNQTTISISITPVVINIHPVSCAF